MLEEEDWFLPDELAIGNRNSHLILFRNLYL